MITTEIAPGILHETPEDMQNAISADSGLLLKWNALTPIQRNEWICWVTIVKKDETRTEHIARMIADLTAGKRKPCCWPGCPHRRPEAKKWFKQMKA